MDKLDINGKPYPSPYFAASQPLCSGTAIIVLAPQLSSMKRLLRAVALLTTAVALPAYAQVFDFTGNSQLNGAYVFREAIYAANADGSVGRAIVDYGTITFNGNGSYTESVSEVDSKNGLSSYTQSGSYSISASGYGYITHPFDPSAGLLYGSVTNGVFIGSATESGINDMMVAVPASSATNGTFSGNYTLDYFNIGTGLQVDSFDSTTQLAANGNGNIGTVQVKTYQGKPNTQPINQSESGVTYSFTSGIGTLKFPTTTNLAIQGNKRMFISPDGNLIFGGSDTGFDFFVGVRRASGTPPLMSGLYFTGAINDVPGEFDTFYGAFTANNTVELEHQRFLSTANANGRPQNYTATGVLPSSPTSDYTDTLSAVEYTISQDAALRIGIGQSPYIGLRIAARAPQNAIASTNLPFIFPTGVINAASYAPFTSGVAPGELVSIYGANLATSTVVSQGGTPFPTKLGEVQVLMNNRPAALYFVSPGQIAAIVPYGTTENVVQIQVNRNGTTSNAITEFRYLTAPGIFSQSQSGEGIGAVLHADYSLVTEARPAKPGETVQVFLTGLGGVFPSIADGGLGGATTGSLNTTLPGAVGGYIDGLAADVAYSGLAPGLAGLYQVNLTVPAGAANGNVFLDIATSDAYTSQVALPIGSAIASDAIGSRKAAEKPFVRRR